MEGLICEVPVFNCAGEMSTAANCRLVSLLFVVRKIVKKLGNYMPVDHLEECGLHSDFQRVFRSTTDLLVVVPY